MTCSKCATNKAGKRTCCARGGSWFQQCGDPGDSKFDHTWAEGLLACKPASSAESQGQSLVTNQTTNPQEGGAAQQEIISSIAGRTGKVYHGAVNFAGSDKSSTLTVTIISLLFTTGLLFN